MLSGQAIMTYLGGAWRLMSGRSDGLRLLDLSADGFWNSFGAILVAAPVLVVSWVVSINGSPAALATSGERLTILVRLAVIDVIAWIAPLVVLALTARTLAISDRYVQYVVASNWGSVITAWLTLPALLAALALGEENPTAATIGLALFVVALVLSWRLTHAALGRGPTVATFVFVITLVVSFALVFGLRPILGLDLAQPSG